MAEFKSEQHKDKILERIKKLLAVSEGTSFEKEAETALKMAQNYMKSYGLSLTDVQLADELKGGIVEEICTEHCNRQNPEKFELLLSKAVAIVFDCRAAQTYVDCKKTKVVFIGYKKDVEMARLVFTTLYVSARSSAVRTIKEAGIPRLSFLWGVAEKLWERATEEKEEAKKEPTGRFELMVVSKNQIIKDWMRKNGYRTINGTGSKTRLNSQAYEAGREHGNRMDMMNREKVSEKRLQLTHK